MNLELELIAKRLAQAKRPEDIFGEIQGSSEDLLSTLRKNYDAIVNVVHPDLYENTDEKKLAYVTLGYLIEWFGRAEERVKFGIYGRTENRSPQSIIQTKKRT
jgi:hypothetical protein